MSDRPGQFLRGHFMRFLVPIALTFPVEITGDTEQRGGSSRPGRCWRLRITANGQRGLVCGEDAFCMDLLKQLTLRFFYT